jgi:predicted ATPase/DNA-binding winged helix-turn-helix (wHTH) protein
VPREKRIAFDDFSLDLTNECLLKGSQVIKLRPKPFAVLHYLLQRPGQLATKEELIRAAWPETFVGEAVLKVAIRELREVLDDDPKSPRFIQTAHRRGYRFIGRNVRTVVRPTKTQDIAESHSISTMPPGRRVPLPGKVVGRERALSRMKSGLENMLGGERQILFVSGEAGIGKTALVDLFARSLAAYPGTRTTRGQCMELYGTSEAYLPVLEAIGRLARDEQQVVDVLRSHAPMWLLQMPSLMTAADGETLARVSLGANRDRMLREMSEALEVLTADLPLVLILEDLHWSDYLTLDLISYLARQRHPAHLMLVGTYRTADLLASGHPLRAVKQELLAKQQCEELELEYLSQDDVADYLSIRFPRNRFPEGLVRLIHRRTDGNPLFMVNTVDYLVAGEFVAWDGQNWSLIADFENIKVGVPDGIKQMIDKQVNHLDQEERLTLQAASVAGPEFSMLAVVAGLGEDRVAVEARCRELARRHQFIQDRGVQELPNGEAVSRYGFIHGLYQNVLYEGLPPSRRVELHRRIGEEGETVYGERAREIAAELAMHFERGSSYRRSARYLKEAAVNAIRRFAYSEAVGLARRGLELLRKLPDTPECAARELSLYLTLGVPLIATEGYASPDVGRTYRKARELCQRLAETADMPEILWGLWAFHTVRAELNTSREIGEELLRLSEALSNPGLAMRAHLSLGAALMHMGEFVPAMEHLEKALDDYDPARHRDDAFLYSRYAGVALPCYAAWVLWYLGQPDRALERMLEALKLAQSVSDPHGLAHAYYSASNLYHLRREERLAREYADKAIDVATAHGMSMYQAMATVTGGWALVEEGRLEEAIEQLRQALTTHKATGARVARPHFLALLAAALSEAHQVDEGRRIIDESLSLALQNAEFCYLAELYRVKGEILLKQADVPGLSPATTPGAGFEAPHVTEAEACFQKSIEVARQQQAKSWELRAAMSLARLYKERDKREEGRVVLAQIYDQFTEGFDTLDLREARALLNELS